MRTKESKPSGGLDGLPAGLRLLDDAKDNVGLAEILAALTAEPAQPDMRLREVEDSIRRHWAVLRNLVREHSELSRAAKAGGQQGAVAGQRPALAQGGPVHRRRRAGSLPPNDPVTSAGTGG